MLLFLCCGCVCVCVCVCVVCDCVVPVCVFAVCLASLLPKPPLQAQLAEKELRGKPLEDLTWHTPEGIAIKQVNIARIAHVAHTLHAVPTDRFAYLKGRVNADGLRWYPRSEVEEQSNCS